MKYYLDTEFNEDGVTIDLISIAIIAEDGREFYRISTEFDPSRANEFVVKQVFPYIVDPKSGKRIDPQAWMSREQIKQEMLKFVGEDDNIEFWAWYGSYDWVALAQLFGTMVDLPKGWPMYVHELKQLADELGNPRGPAQENSHHPVADAKWAKAYHEYLLQVKRFNTYQGVAERQMRHV